MTRRRSVALGLAVMLVLGVASATSLGTFSGVSLWATAHDEEACQVPDPTNDVIFYDDLTGLVLDLTSDLAGSTVGEIELRGLDGDCTEMRPVVIVIGFDGLLATDESVLSRTELAVIDGTSTSVTLTVDGTDEINALVSDDQPTAVRVGFCPGTVAACGVSP